jgi:hypothetical protein
VHLILFSSPKKSFHLPIYANAMAHASIIDLATLWFVGDHRILQYLDLSAIEGDVAEGLSSNGGNDQLCSSSQLALGRIFSSHSDRNYNESSASDFAD